MIFPVQDIFDGTDQKTLRHVSFSALKQIQATRDHYLGTCQDRPSLAPLDDEQRLISFGALLMGGFILANSREIAAPGAEDFLKRLAGRAPAASGSRKMLARLIGRSDTSAGAHMRDRMLPVLATWPAFDKEAYLQGTPQDDAFMAEFLIDFPAMREIAFQASKPMQMLGVLEAPAITLVPIIDSFRQAAFTGIAADKLSAFFESAMLRSDRRDADLEPAM